MSTGFRSLFSFLALASLLFIATDGLAAQSGTLTGRVVDAETNQPLASASVIVLGTGGEQVTGAVSGSEGQFRFTVDAGTYALVVSMIGYETQRVDGISVAAGATEAVTVSVRSRAFVLNPITVTASRREEKALDAPASVSIVGQERIQERTVVTPAEHVKALPGVDVVQTGVSQSNVVTRGFNNVFSGALLVITDNRYAHVPSLRFNAHNMIPATDLDLERIEVALGPGAALYGPNAASGVMHLITTSPIDDPQSSVTLAGGERSLFQGAFRVASRVSDEFGIRVSGQYFRADDWEYIDPVEAGARQEAIQGGANPETLLIGQRDFLSERFATEVRADWRPWDDGEIILSGAVNQAGSSIELTGLGAAQADDWRYTYGQARLRKGNLFGQVFYNRSDAGDTYLLRTGDPIVDRSWMFVSQLQHSASVGERQSFTYGIDFQHTEPVTDGTITGRNEGDADILEAGVYVHSETRLTDRWDLVTALRVDHHSRLADPVISPRAALVFRPQEDQNIRLTYNRAFSTPTTNNLFLDLAAQRNILPFPPGFPNYDIRTLGVPESGFSFRRDCQGGVGSLCMRSPFNVGNEDQFIPANAVILWPVVVQAFQQLDPQLGALLAQLPPPDPEQVGSVLRRLNAETGQFELVGPESVDDIARMVPTITNTFEVGYKGILADRLLLSTDVYYSRIEDFIGPLRVETPNVFFDPQGLAQYLGTYLGQMLPPEQIGAIVEQIAQIPMGTVTPQEQLDPTDLMLTYRNFGRVNLWGADLAGQLLLNDQWSLRASYSYVNRDFFEDVGVTDIALNAPQNKLAAAVEYQNRFRGLTAEARMRWVDSFPMNSGVYVGNVDSYAVVDANVGYRLPWAPSMTLTLTGTNIFDDRHQQFIGAPELGRMVIARVRYDF
jgi:outer membrane receptor for ferrienterochelin and colicins